MYYMISCKFSEFPFELCRKRAFNRAKKALFWSRAKILPSGYHAQLDSCAGPFLGVVQKQKFLEIYSPLHKRCQPLFRTNGTQLCKTCFQRRHVKYREEVCQLAYQTSSRPPGSRNQRDPKCQPLQIGSIQVGSSKSLPFLASSSSNMKLVRLLHLHLSSIFKFNFSNIFLSKWNMDLGMGYTYQVLRSKILVEFIINDPGIG